MPSIARRARVSIAHARWARTESGTRWARFTIRDMRLEADAFAGLWPWEPITPHDVAQLLRGLPASWWIAGGAAIELFLGRRTRRHYDLDLAILRPDQLALRRHLAGWELCVASPDRRLEQWDGRALELPIERFWARPEPGAPWWFDGHLEEVRDDRWVYRRDERIWLPLSRFGCRTVDGLPYLAPEVALFYMLINPMPKAKTDFRAACPHLSPERRDWLRAALALVQPGHPVLPLL
jgi:hypothetical protein